MATRFLISVKCRSRRSFHRASYRRDVFSHPRPFLALDLTRGVCKRSPDERNIVVRKGGGKKESAEISRDCGNKKEGCGGNGERTCETTERLEARDDLISSRPSCARFEAFLSASFSRTSRVYLWSREKSDRKLSHSRAI